MKAALAWIVVLVVALAFALSGGSERSPWWFWFLVGLVVQEVRMALGEFLKAKGPMGAWDRRKARVYKKAREDWERDRKP